jgi:hypothetical protein
VYSALVILLCLLIYHRLVFRVPRDGEARCRSCDHVLRCLTEPRCPECGIHI